MKTIHMIGNAHVDPIWLWDKADGIDAVLATARSACDRLDEYPEFIFTSSTVWFHQQIERIDPDLFERVKSFVAKARWQLVGPMYVEPDCNLPSEASFRKQLEIGQSYFTSRFGMHSSVGYNIDSFGHGAYLPRFLREAGVDSYVFMRPMPKEKNLPSNIFRWQSPDGCEVTAFRISAAYATPQDELQEHVQKTIADIPGGMEHTMCFYGVGDHGGGPTKWQIEWVLNNQNAFEGCRLVFSHPVEYFHQIHGSISKLPIVKGELQHHSIGCYTVERRIKAAMVQAESALEQAQKAAQLYQQNADDSETFDEMWQELCFAQFHDILGGTCIESQSERTAGTLRHIVSRADDIITCSTRRYLRGRAEPGVHHVVVHNLSGYTFAGYVEHEPWLQWKDSEIELLDENGQKMTFQIIRAQTNTFGLFRIVFPIVVEAGSLRILQIREKAGSQQCLRSAPKKTNQLTCDKMKLSVQETGIAVKDIHLGFEVFEDKTDTWSHSSINRYTGKRVSSFAFSGGMLTETGPILHQLSVEGMYDESCLFCNMRTYLGKGYAHIKSWVLWSQVCQRLVLRCTLPFEVTRREDFVSGGFLARDMGGLEYPFSGIIKLSGRERGLGIIGPEVFSCSAVENRIELTLLRSPYAAHHDKFPIEECAPQTVLDQGKHFFEFMIVPEDFDQSNLLALYRQMKYRPVVHDLTG